MEQDSDGEAGVAISQLDAPSALTTVGDDASMNWVIDSGCTHHMTCHREWFVEFEEIKSSKILLGDYTTIETLGVGTVKLNTRGGTIKMLKNVRYVPSLRRNLISTGTLDKLGFKHCGGDSKVIFMKNSKVALWGPLVNGMYILEGETVLPEVCNTQISSVSAPLWHSRLGHMSYKNLQILVNNGILRKKDVGPEFFCEHGIMGKAKRVSFGTGKHETSNILEYLHADLWGSPNVHPSLYGNKYFLSIIDDHSRKVWVCFLRTKDETFLRFSEWKVLVENQVDRKVKCLRTDNGLEFCNLAFDGFCRKNGIKRHRTCSYTPQQNGVAERMNRTIMEKVRCLLSESGLSEDFWSKAAAFSVYTINRSPLSAVGFKVPEEIWLGRKSGYLHMRRFGSVAYVHTNQGKLKPRAVKGVFIGYPPGTKGYKIWLLDDEECIVSRNVKFCEDMLYKDTLKEAGHIDKAPQQLSE